MSLSYRPLSKLAFFLPLSLVMIARTSQIKEDGELAITKTLVVMIEGKLGDTTVQGAGIVFRVDDKGVAWIATANHLMRRGDASANALQVRFQQSPEERVGAALYPEARAEYDLAILTAPAPTAASFPFKRVADVSNAKESDRVYAIGYPTWGVTYNPGTITTVGALRVKVDAPSIRRGHSGGALIDDRKLLVGIVLDTDGVTADAFRIDRAIDAIRGEFKIPVQLTTNADVQAPLSKRNLPAEPKRLAGGVQVNFVLIQPGSFAMGCSLSDMECYEIEKPAHQVRITRAFEIGQTEVTQAQWKAVMGTNPSKFNGEQRPVENVTWSDVQEFINKLNAGNDGYRYRLPTEAEWEYAARAGTTGAYAGNLDSIAWYDTNSGSQTQAVAQKQPNAWGLYDMSGNVWEWVQDSFGQFGAANQTDPKGPQEGDAHTMRGGSWHWTARVARVSTRIGNYVDFHDYDSGFRLVRDSIP